MDDRFQRLTLSISHIQKTIQKIKTAHMGSIGMKGSHAICISCMIHHPKGLTGAELCKLAQLDKAAVSRILKDLEDDGYIHYDEAGSERASGRKYRSKIFLTDKGMTMARDVASRIHMSVEAGKNTISDAELDEFYRVLNLLTENLDELYEKLSSNETEREEEE